MCGDGRGGKPEGRVGGVEVIFWRVVKESLTKDGEVFQKGNVCFSKVNGNSLGRFG